LNSRGRGCAAHDSGSPLFAADGDPLEIRTRIERVWIAGDEVDLRQDRQCQLYQRYLNRPRPETAAPK